jgi:PAS domain S-box-containing protein
MTSALTELILDRAPSAVISLDERGLVAYWNPSAEELFGIASDEALGRPVAELIIPERFRADHAAGIERFLATGAGPLVNRRVEVTAVRADGSEFPVELTVSAVRQQAAWTFTGFVLDLSERERGEQERGLLVEELRTAVRLAERRFDAVVGSLSDPVTIRDRQNRLIYANRAALSHLGIKSTEELLTTPPDTIMADYFVSSETGDEISMDQIPSVRILAGEDPPEPLVIRTVHRHTGAQRWNLLKAAPLLDEAGEVEATIMVIEDVTEQKRTERQAAFIAHASEVLASSLDYQQTLRNVAQLAVPDIADWCAVDLIDEDGDREPVAVAHVDPHRLALAEQLRQYEPARLDADQGIGLVVRTGEPLLYPDISDEMLRRAAVDDRHLELLREVGFRSALIVPMRIGTQTLGTLTLVSAESGRVLEQADLELADQVAARAAVAIENSTLYSQRSKIAHTLQQSLLPAQLPDIQGYELAGVYIPAYAETEVGGDFYDAWEVGDGWIAIMGDVTGKGIEAAALTALVRHTVRATSEFVSSPALLLDQVDRALKRQRARSICTALCLRLEPERAILAVGGHPLPLVLTAEVVARVGQHGPLLGGFAGARWEDTEIELEPGATIVTYTDGVTDAVGADGTRYGIQRLIDTLEHSRGRSASGVIEVVTNALASFQIGPHADDTAVLALRRVPAAPLESTAASSGRTGEPVVSLG